MKKILSLIFAILMIVSVSSPLTVYAVNESFPEWQDQTELDELLNVTENNLRVSGLISTYSIGIKKSGSNLIIAGMTTCFPEVVKCGLKELVIQRRLNSGYSWSDYITYKDLYEDSFSYILSKSVAVPSGYQYRVTCVHYAKRNILMTEKINNTSNTVVM